jgi:outer membrane protein assembly factor BamA
MDGDERRVLYLTARAVLLAAVVGWGLGGGLAAHGQSEASSRIEAPAVEWRLVREGERVDWPDAVPTAPLDSVRRIGRAVVEQWRQAGHYYARLDSAVVDTAGPRPTIRLHAHRGPRVTVGRLRIEGAEAVPARTLRRLMDTKEGDPLNPRRLEADVQALLDRYEEAGHPLAQIRVAETSIDAASTPRLRVTLRIEEGPSLWLKRIEVPEDARVSPGLVARLAGLEEGAPLTNYDPGAIRTALQNSPLFTSVGAPELRVTSKGGAILRVPVEETPPGSFDAVLGYLPPSGVRDDGQLVGSGHLLLENLFGGGRRFDLTLDRRPGQTSLFTLSGSDPYIFGLPLRLTVQFEGEQRDSTYGERSYGLDAGYQFGDGFEVTGSLSREVVQPGQAGARLRGGRQRIPRSRTLFYGLGVRYEGVDRRVNPRRGLRLRVQVEQGRKNRARRRITAAGDTTRSRRALRQERLRGRVRGFVPLFDRQVLALGGDASVLRSRAYDRSDLFRIGGAESLRGYDEDRFLGNVTVRGLLEYRLQLDRRSYAYAFGDLGYVARPALGQAPARRGWHPGYGLGLQLQTAIGRIKTTYALNPEVATPINGRIHFGLSVAL